MGELALQLYTLRKSLSLDVRGSIRKIVDCGYRFVEIAGCAGMAPEQFHTLLREEGVSVVSSHVGWDRLESDLVGVIEEAKSFHVPTIVLPSLPPRYRDTKDQYSFAAKKLNQWGEVMRNAGIEFGYHNHAFEFVEISPGLFGYDVLVEETAQSLVNFEVDIYWVSKAHADLKQLLNRLGKRVKLMHIKDIGPMPDEKDLPVGEGLLPWAELLSINDVRNFIVEEDNVWSGNVFQDVKISWDNFHRFLA